MTPDRCDLVCANVTVTPASSREYEFSAVATADVSSGDGAFRLRRRYEGLPRHNDVVDLDAVDSNDELVDRPDAIHVHTTVFAVDDDREEYLLDEHESWRPPDPAALGDDDAFLAACRDHHLAGIGQAYARAVARGDAESGSD